MDQLLNGEELLQIYMGNTTKSGDIVGTVSMFHLVTVDSINEIMDGIFAGAISDWAKIDKTGLLWDVKPTGVSNSVWATHLLIHNQTIKLEIFDSKYDSHIGLSTIIKGIELYHHYNKDVFPDKYDYESYDNILQYGIYNKLINK